MNHGTTRFCLIFDYEREIMKAVIVHEPAMTTREFPDHLYQVGSQVIEQELDSTGQPRNVTRYKADGNLWVFKETSEKKGDKVVTRRENVACFPPGTWGPVTYEDR